jgi:hypothetical protein
MHFGLVGSLKAIHGAEAGLNAMNTGKSSFSPEIQAIG